MTDLLLYLRAENYLRENYSLSEILHQPTEWRSIANVLHRIASALDMKVRDLIDFQGKKFDTVRVGSFNYLSGHITVPMKQPRGKIIIAPDLDVWRHECETAKALVTAGMTVEFILRSEKCRTT